MYNKKEDISILILLFIPVVIAVGGLAVSFNTVDVIYLLFVLAIVFKYFHNRIVSQNK